MPKVNNSTHSRKSVYPIAVSLSMIGAAIILSFVDLAFLNDVIGKILDLGSLESMLIACALGLVGIAIMAHQGIKEAHGSEKLRDAIVHYLLWIGLGLAFVLIRLFSASIMQLDTSLGDERIIQIAGLNVREVDLVLAPLMFFLYLATGLLAKDGFKNLLLNPDFDIWWENRKKTKAAQKLEEERLRGLAATKVAKSQEKAEREQEKRLLEVEQARIKSALAGSYGNALIQYRKKEDDIKEKYQRISTNIDYIKTIDKQEAEFETKTKPDLLTIVQKSIQSVQFSVALAIHKKTKEDIAQLRETIEKHNHN